MMLKICPKCGMKNDENVAFCTNCGNRLAETLEEFRSSFETEKRDNFKQQDSGSYKEPAYFNEPRQTEPTPQYPVYGQPSPYMPEKKSKKNRMILPILSIIIIAIIVVAAVFFVFFTGEKNNEEENNELDQILNTHTNKIEGGPSVSLKSLGSGNLKITPASDCVAKYNMYYLGDKIGESVEANAGITTYNGKSCYKILGRSDVELSVSGKTVAFTVDSIYYVEVDNNMPVYMSIVYDYTQPEELKSYDMTVDITWNQQTGEITSTSSVMGQKGTAVAYLPLENWGIISSLSDLYVGYSKEFDYTMSTQGVTGAVHMTVNVLNNEGVTVPAGTFENCYVLEIDQDLSDLNVAGISSANIKIWISEDGVVPKASSTMSGLQITQELEGYYTT